MDAFEKYRENLRNYVGHFDHVICSDIIMQNHV